MMRHLETLRRHEPRLVAAGRRLARGGEGAPPFRGIDGAAGGVGPRRWDGSHRAARGVHPDGPRAPDAR